MHSDFKISISRHYKIRETVLRVALPNATSSQPQKLRQVRIELAVFSLKHKKSLTAYFKTKIQSQSHLEILSNWILFQKNRRQIMTS